jgi:NADPH2:quinone reductase
MISFGNASGSLEKIDVKKMIQPKGLYFTRPSMAQYLSTKNEIREASEKLFEKIKLGHIKIEVFKKYNLQDVVQAHKDLQSRKILGPSVIVP